MKKRLLKLFITVIVLMVSIATSVEATPSTKKSESLETRIQELYDQRSKLLLKNDTEQRELDKIEKKLQELGVKFLSSEEVQKKFHNANEDLMTIYPQVAVPNQYNVKWSTYTSTLFVDGKAYDVQRLVAQPVLNYDSNLKDSGYKVLYSTYNWKAGSMNAIKTVGKSAAGSIPGANYVMTVYDTVSSFVNGISRETVVNDADISYSWSQTTTVVFSYVKLHSQSDYYQELSYISSKVDLWVGYQYPTFTYSTSTGYLSPTGVQGERTFSVIPDRYNSAYDAIISYKSAYGGPLYETVDRVEITGIETKLVSNIYIVNPLYPSHIY